MSLEVKSLVKRYAGRPVVQNVSFRVSAGELVVLLGPSGSGKSTVLRMVAGLTSADSGTVRIDDRDVTALSPQERDLGFVFQNYALFEHLSVADNVEFALRVRAVDRRARQARREELLELVGLGGSARKFPSELSGGQRQRTALARALAHSPRLLLLDEPFGALDARIRQELRQGLRDLLKRIGTTAIFVTHDQEEAFAVADRILVLHRGRLLEAGTPQQLYREPRTEFVASFIGRANLLPGELTASGPRIRLLPGPPAPDAIPRRVKILLRPEKLRLAPPDSTVPADRNLFSHIARVERLEYLGASERLHLSLQSDGAYSRCFQLEALRSTDVAQADPLAAGDAVMVFGNQMHAVPQPDLRVLVVAPDDADGHALAKTALAWGEQSHALVTLLGAAARAPGLHGSLEHYRQAFAGDLRLVDPGAHEPDPWRAAQAHLAGESYDLVMMPASLRQPDRVIRFLLATGAQQVLLAGRAGNPLAAGASGCWIALLRGFANSQPDLQLLVELADASGADVDVRDLHDGGRGLHQPPGTADARLVALDLGPRSALGARQQQRLQAEQDQWVLLMVQPDEADLALLPSAEFRRGAVAGAGSSS